ncbi:MAG: rhomboid family intramembrane serine protease [Candidatus Methylomirabilis oxygeniifera]|uniref:Putative peptidase, S54 (Rhomboid) family n=1 Tax=Methylomirabilis oxygeniifera TaxID=671143 RepID=D5MH82_METO1|nr:MAG: rhomboid family intramembrane serine protease [Candidatus Methylomirabilis oxyfera]CBE69114.1 putative peptidase, S54 (Rhomboid) family [Candidatus Methylomirabilis oxyfera]
MIPLRDNIPSSRAPVLTIGLIAVNVLVYGIQMMLPPQEVVEFIRLYGLIPLEISSGDPFIPHPVPLYATLFTSMFVHGGLFHLGGNMLYLWIFGDNVEDRMGRPKFLIFYLLSGVGAAAAQIWADPASKIPMVGASGAISGVLGAYLFLFPRARVLTLIPLGFFSRVAEIPALVVLGFWILVQVLNGVMTLGVQVGGVAWLAHVGGFVAGLVMVIPFAGRRKRLHWGDQLS